MGTPWAAAASTLLILPLLSAALAPKFRGLLLPFLPLIPRDQLRACPLHSREQDEGNLGACRRQDRDEQSDMARRGMAVGSLSFLLPGILSSSLDSRSVGSTLSMCIGSD